MLQAKKFIELLNMLMAVGFAKDGCSAFYSRCGIGGRPTAGLLSSSEVFGALLIPKNNLYPW